MNTIPSRAGLLLSGRLQPRALEPFDTRRLLRSLGPPIIFAALVLGAWQLATALSAVHESILPSPLEIARALIRDRSVLLSAAATTLVEILLGYAIAIVLGAILAVLVTSSLLVERAIYPWLLISQMIPILAIAPLVVIWTGFDIRPKLIVIALVSFFPIAVNTIDGLRATDRDLLDLLRSLGAGPYQRLRIARAPTALPYFFSGLRVAAALAVIGAVFAEWVGSSNGLGYLILTYNAQTATADMFATIVVLATIGIALFATVATIERIALPWYRTPADDDNVRTR
jgi:ABC-type nitrate/sulfonate/bicarbonate transport system permease component